MISIAKINGNKENKADISRFGEAEAQIAAAFHESLPEYEKTPLRDLKNLAEKLGIAGFYVKDESFRFGLNAFKGLGGSYALEYAVKGRKDAPVFAAATDGNHGRGVAWAAKRSGYEAHIFMPKGTVSSRLENIRKLGAHAENTPYDYDNTVLYTKRLAKKNGWIVIQDTAEDENDDIPVKVMQGYTTIGVELVRQLSGKVPTHVFLQAGVGSFAAAIIAFMTDYYREKAPKFIIVEPDGANCFYLSAKADDGRAHTSPESRSMMAGLCCETPCSIAWEIIRDYADFALTCPDETSAFGMRLLAKPLGDDERIVSGESGAVTTGIAVQIVTDDAEIKKTLGIGEASVILCISTEGATDPENYQKITAGADTPLL